MQQSSHRASIPPCVIVESWLTLGCIFGCARSSAISREAWPGSWAGVYIRVCFPWLVELGCTHWCVCLGCAIAMPPSAMRKRPASAMVDSGPAVALAAYKWDATGYTGLATETQQWTQRPRSQPFLGIKLGDHLVRALVSNGRLPSQSTK